MKILCVNTRKGVGDQVIFIPYLHSVSKKYKSPVSLLAKEDSRAKELLEDDNLTYKIIKSCVSLNSAITEITREDHPELSKSFFATANYFCLLYTSPSPRDRG